MTTATKTYFGFAFSAAMLPTGTVSIVKIDLPLDEVKAALQKGVLYCLNPSHQATIDAARAKYGLDITVPEKPAQIKLGNKDSIIVMQVRGLPRLTDRHEYTSEEISNASFQFVQLTVYF